MGCAGLLQPVAEASLWALRHAGTGHYLFAENGTLTDSSEFSLNDSAFHWTFEKQENGTVAIRNAGEKAYISDRHGLPMSDEAAFWTPAHTPDYRRRIFTASSGRTLAWNGSAEWRIEPVPLPVDLKGRGATLTWTEYQAEEGEIRGRVAGPSTSLSDPVSEAVGRMAVYLDREGDFVAWTVEEDADGFSLRYCIPDAPEGGGIEASLSLYINGEKTETLSLTSRHAWIYGPEHRGARLWNDDPKNGNRVAKYFDTARLVLKKPVRAGDRLMLRKDPDDSAEYYLIDLIELEKIPPTGIRPDDYLCITGFGAVPNDGKDDSAALKEALVSAARRKAPGVWIPAGVFDFMLPEPAPSEWSQMAYQRFKLNQIHLQGAGMWHSELRGQGLAFWCEGNRIRVSDMAFDWQGTSRRSAILFMGAVGVNSEFWNLYATRCALLLSISDSTSRNLLIRDSRLRSLFAGGINLRGGHQNAVMENIHVRGTGDDGLILWSPGDEDAVSTLNCTIRNSTVEAPWMANGYLLAGGEGSRLENCVVKDGARHCGVRVSTQIYITPTRPFSGSTTIEGVTLIRCGSEKDVSYNGALLIEPHGHDINGLVIRDCDILSAPFSGIQVYTKNIGRVKGSKEAHAVLQDVRIQDAALYGVHIMEDTPGTIAMTGVEYGTVLHDRLVNGTERMKVEVSP